MTWIEGAPLREFADVFPLLAEEQQEVSQEALGLRWLKLMCEALGVLHRNGLIHGDISPRNMIVSGNDLVLTDYDFVAKIGERPSDGGTVLYCSPSYAEDRPASPSDDIYSLAASFFHVVFDKEPFQYGGIQAKERGLNWEDVNREEFNTLATFLDRATHTELRTAILIRRRSAQRASKRQEPKGAHPPASPQLAPAVQSTSARQSPRCRQLRRYRFCEKKRSIGYSLSFSHIRVRAGVTARPADSTLNSHLRPTSRPNSKRLYIEIFVNGASGS